MLYFVYKKRIHITLAFGINVQNVHVLGGLLKRIQIIFVHTKSIMTIRHREYINTILPCYITSTHL